MTERKIRVLIAKPGLDGHERGARVVARALRDAGMEVVYTHPTDAGNDRRGRTARRCGRTGVVHPVWRPHDPVSANHGPAARQGMDDVVVLVGGIIPTEDVAPLRGWASAASSARTSTADIAEFIRQQVRI